MQKLTIFLAFLLLTILSCDNLTEPKPDPTIVTRKIAYCYQPLQNGIHQIFTINMDGTENKKLIESSIGLNHHDWSQGAQKMACVGYIGSNNSTWSIHIFNIDGSNLTRLTTQADVWDTEPAWSPDGTQIAFTRMYPNQNYREELWIMDANGDNQSYIGIEGFAAKWSSNGTKFIYSSKSSGNYEIYTCLANGTAVQQLTNTTIDEWFPVWSHNDSLIAYNAYPSGNYNLSEIYIMDANGDNNTRLTNNNVSDSYPRFSPDDSLISFTQDLSSQQWEIFVMQTDGSDVRQVTISPSGITAINAVWRPEN